MYSNKLFLLKIIKNIKILWVNLILFGNIKANNKLILLNKALNEMPYFFNGEIKLIKRGIRKKD